MDIITFVKVGFIAGLSAKGVHSLHCVSVRDATKSGREREKPVDKVLLDVNCQVLVDANTVL